MKFCINCIYNNENYGCEAMVKNVDNRCTTYQPTMKCLTNKPANYIITVKVIVERWDMDLDDLETWWNTETEVRISAETKEKALDEFHSTYPIAVLEDFDITIERC